MKRKINVLFLGILAVVFLAFPVGAVINTLSGSTSLFYENRSPAALPQLTFESLWDGTFATQADSFVSDRMPGRDPMIQADTALGMALGHPVSHGVITAGEQLLPFHGYLTWDVSYTTDKAAAMVEPLAAIHRQVTDYGGTLVYLGVPQQYSYFRDNYPDYMDNRVWNLDAMTQALMNALNAHTGLDLKICTEDDLVFEYLPEPFLGSQNRKIYGLWNTDERLEIAHLKDPVPFTRLDNGMEVPSALYAFPEPGEYATYSVYMGGDMAETIIQTNRPELPKLLLVGDSFTNAMETLLWASFDESRSLDYRYYTGPVLSEYIEDYQPDVVVLFRDDTSYLSDTGNGNLS